MHEDDTDTMTAFLVVTAVCAVVGTIVFLVLLLWAAREDGRDQRRRDREHPR